MNNKYSREQRRIALRIYTLVDLQRRAHKRWHERDEEIKALKLQLKGKYQEKTNKEEKK